MSVSLWAWNPGCEGDFCPGDCDHCSRKEEDDAEDRGHDKVQHAGRGGGD